MFFTKVGRVAAWMIFVLSIVRMATGLLVAFTAEDPSAAAQHYFAEPTTGAMIDQAFQGLGIAIALGVLTEISRNVFSNTKSS